MGHGKVSEKIIITVSKVDEDGEIISREQVSEKIITPPTDIANFGYNQQEQLDIMKAVQQKMLDFQVDFLKSETWELS